MGTAWASRIGLGIEGFDGLLSCHGHIKSTAPHHSVHTPQAPGGLAIAIHVKQLG